VGYNQCVAPDPLTIDADSSHRPFTPRATLALALVVAVGAALRLYGLQAESAWLDEAFAVGIARDGLERVLYETALDVHPPLYYVLLTGWLKLAGTSIGAARLFSVLCSLGVLVAAHVTGTRLAGRRVGLITAALLAVSPFQVEFAQEARMYAQLTLLATLSTLGFIKLFEPLRLHWFLFYVVVTALMTYTQVYGLFIIGAQALAIVVDTLWRRRAALDATGAWIAAQALVFAGFLWWLPVFTWQVSLVQTSFWISEPEPMGFLGSFRAYAASPGMLSLLWLLIAIGAFHLARRPTAPPATRPALFFVLPWLAGPILFPFVLSLIGSPIFLPKYTIAASVPFALLAAAGISAVPFHVIRSAILVACVALSVRALPAYYNVASKDGWRDAVPIVEALARVEDAVVLYPYFNKIAFDFYRTREDLQVRPFPLFAPPPPPDGWPVALARATAGRDRIWLVTLQADESKAPVLEALTVDYERTSYQVQQRVAIYRFDRRP
jgi:mannosyltransferase